MFSFQFFWMLCTLVVRDVGLERVIIVRPNYWREQDDSITMYTCQGLG
jgi:hypothetical protein